MKITPKVGMGGTQNIGSDRYPFTVIAVSPNGTRCTIQMDTYTRTATNGQSEAQEYAYQPDPKGVVYQISKRKNGRWYQVGEPMAPMLSFTLGQRRAYLDPSC